MCQKVAHFLKRCVKKWSTFPKSVSKSDAPSKVKKLSSKKVRQKVESFFKRCAKKWSTFLKSASKSGAPMKISGVLGEFAPN